ncbi:MAG: NfeD family protein [Pyrobaculum sp.]
MKRILLTHRAFYIASIVFIFITIAIAIQAIVASAQPQEGQYVVKQAIVATIRGTVDQGMKRYIQDLIDRAYRENAVLILDVQSPGGFLGDTMDIADAIFKSKAPVIGYASGDSFSGATLILVPVHILAVNPRALVGDAQPVTIDQTGRLVPITEPKIVNPLVKKFTDYASQRGRNATLVAMFILNATVVNGEEAVKLHFADLTASSLDELVGKIRGRVVNTTAGSYRLEIDSISQAGDCFSCRILSFFSDPTVSSIMLTIGIFSAIFAISSGHLIALPVALVFIILGLVGAGLQVDLLTMALILIGASFIVAGFAIGHADGGILMTAGAVMIALGAALLPVTGREILIAGSSGFLTTIYGFSLGVGIASATVGGIVAWQLVLLRRRKSEIFEIVGKEGVAKEDIEPGREGYVLVEGELWRAVSKEPIKAGEPIVVIGKKGFLLEVKKKT